MVFRVQLVYCLPLIPNSAQDPGRKISTFPNIGCIVLLWVITDSPQSVYLVSPSTEHHAPTTVMVKTNSEQLIKLFEKPGFREAIPLKSTMCKSLVRNVISLIDLYASLVVSSKHFP